MQVRKNPKSIISTKGTLKPENFIQKISVFTEDSNLGGLLTFDLVLDSFG